MSHVFISYSRSDIDFAQTIVAALAANNLDTWADWMSIPPSVGWESEIYRGIEQANVFLFLISPDSCMSEMCNKEIAHAVKNGKRIITVLFRDTKPDTIPPDLSKIQWIRCREGLDDFNEAIAQIQTTIHTDYEWLKYHTELQLKAIQWEQKTDNSRLLWGKQLQEAEQQLAEVSAKDDPQPTIIQRKYILASRRNQNRIGRWITIISVSFVIVTAVLSYIAIRQRNLAVREASIARAGELIAQAQTQMERKKDLALLLSVEAYQRENNWNTKNGLFTVLQTYVTVGSLEKSLLGHSDYVNSLVFRPDGTILASGSQDSTVRLWDVITAEPKFSPLMGHEGGVTSLAFSPDGTRLASGSWDKSIRLWNIKSGASLDAILTGHTGGITALAFSSDGKTLVSSSEDNTVRLWDLDSGTPINRILLDEARVLSVAFSPDGKSLAAAVEQNAIYSIRLWNVGTYEQQGSPLLGHSDWITSIAFSPDSKILASGSADQTIRIWDLSTYQQINNPLTGFNDWVSTVAFSPDGKILVSGSWDRSIRLWDVASHRPIGNPILDHRNWVTSVAISPDGKLIASASKDSTLRWWPLGPARWIEFACEQSKRNLTREEWAQYLADEPYHATCAQWELDP